MTSLLRGITRVDSIENHCFLPRFLSPKSVVIDLGVNDGHFSRTIARRYGVRCYGVEANPKLFAGLKEGDGTRFFNFAVSGDDAPVSFRISEQSQSSSAINVDVPDYAETVTVPGKTFSSFVAEQGFDRIDLVKVDVEGAEVPMFRSTDDALLRRVDQFSIEFHDHCGYVSVEDGVAIRERLGRLGFRSVKFSPNNTNWLFYQERMAGPLEHSYIRHVVRNLRGVARRVGLREPAG